MNYEAWRVTYQSSEHAARAAFTEAERLRAALDDRGTIHREGLRRRWEHQRCRVQHDSMNCSKCALLALLAPAVSDETREDHRSTVAGIIREEVIDPDVIHTEHAPFATAARIDALYRGKAGPTREAARLADELEEWVPVVAVHGEPGLLSVTEEDWKKLQKHLRAAAHLLRNLEQAGEG